MHSLLKKKKNTFTLNDCVPSQLFCPLQFFAFPSINFAFPPDNFARECDQRRTNFPQGNVMIVIEDMYGDTKVRECDKIVREHENIAIEHDDR